MTSRRRTSRRMRMNRRSSRRLYANAKRRPSLNDDFLAGYVDTMLWASMDQSDESGGRPLNENYTDRDITTDSLIKMAKSCKEFQKAPGVAEAIEGREYDAGKYFWFAHNGHGVGYWDGDWREPDATLLTKASKSFGESYPHVYRGKIYVD